MLTKNCKIIFSMAQYFIYIYKFYCFSLAVSLWDLSVPLLPSDLVFHKAYRTYGFETLLFFRHPGNFLPLTSLLDLMSSFLVLTS